LKSVLPPDWALYSDAPPTAGIVVDLKSREALAFGAQRRARARAQFNESLGVQQSAPDGVPVPLPSLALSPSGVDCCASTGETDQ
jgi:hypothetical protein